MLFLHHRQHRAGQNATGSGCRRSNNLAHAGVAFRRGQRVHLRLAQQTASQALPSQQPTLHHGRLTARQPGDAAQLLIQPLLHRLLHAMQMMAHPLADMFLRLAGFFRLFFHGALCNGTPLRQRNPFFQGVIHQSSLLLRKVHA